MHPFSSQLISVLHAERPAPDRFDPGRGVPFRAAHHAVGAVVKLAEEKGTPLNRLAFADLREIHPGFGRDWAGSFDLSRAMSRRQGTGMPGPAQVRRQFARWKNALG